MVVAQWPSFVEAGIGVPLLASAVASTFVFIMFARSGYATELNFFRANHENLESQRQIIELNIEFSDRIRAFLPREISSRLFRYVEERTHDHSAGGRRSSSTETPPNLVLVQRYSRVHPFQLLAKAIAFSTKA
jgi:hypothetical protein